MILKMVLLMVDWSLAFSFYCDRIMKNSQPT